VLLTLGRALVLRASHLGDGDALSEGIQHLRQSINCVDEGSQHYSENALGISRALLQQYEINPFRNAYYLTEAIQLLEGLGRQSIPDYHREDVLYWTAKAYRAQYRCHGLHDDLRLALAIDEQALRMRPPGHYLRHLSLGAVSEDLALCYESCVVTGSEYSDFERALYLQHEALKLLEEDHPDYRRASISLAKLLLISHTPYTDCKKAFLILIQTLKHIQGNVYQSAVDVIRVLENVENYLSPEWYGGDPSRKQGLDVYRQCLDVYQTLISLLPRLASLDMGLVPRLQVLAQARDLATRAYSHAIGLSQFERAIELLEAGRAVFWAQTLRLRTSFDSVNGEIARELRDISRRLEAAADFNIPPDLNNSSRRARVDTVMAERRHLTTRFDDLVNQV
jgi:hypothetical protein